MADAAMNQVRKYTYKDYKDWPEDERWELIHGEAFAMPSPSRIHQDWVLEIGAQLKAQLRGKPCHPYIAPLDVLPFVEASDDFDSQDTVLQPDVLVVCQKEQEHDKGIAGAPAFVMEVLSPSTGFRDQTEKLKLYEDAGVAEYLVLNPVNRHVWLYRLQNGRYGKPEVWVEPGKVTLASLPGLELDFAVTL